MPEIDYYLAKRPLLSEKECGDAGIIKEFDDRIFLAVIDVLGHGTEAYELAIIILTFLEKNYREELNKIIVSLHEYIKGTRGAVAALCLLDKDSGELKYTGTGNITVRKFGPVNKKFIPRDGIIGYIMGSPKEETMNMDDNDLLLVYSDGITDHFKFEDAPGIFRQSAKETALGVIDRFGKKTDDAVCLALRYRRRQ